MTHEDVQYCGELGIQAAGVVVEYPRPVPWNLTREQGRALVDRAPVGLEMVMVCSGTPVFIEELARYVRPHVAQVHGDETLADVRQMVQRLQPLGIGVFRALRIAPETGKAAGEIPDPVEAAQAIAETGVRAIVVDSQVPHRPGGTGVAVDVATVKRIVQGAQVPVIAAGGLTPDTVGSVIDQTRPWGVDVLSAIEAEPGMKDRSIMKRFYRSVQDPR